MLFRIFGIHGRPGGSLKGKRAAGRLILLLGLALWLAFLGGGCGSQAPAPEERTAPAVDTGAGEKEEEKREPLVVRMEGGDWGYSSPFTHYSRGPGIFKMRYVFDSLLERGEDGYIPWLAESWEIQDGGTTFIFNLREGVKWHDGEEMTAGDVAFSFNYFREHPPVSIGDTILDPGFIKGIEAVSDYRVKITTAEPRATFLYDAGTVRIIPEHIWGQVDNPQEFLELEAVIGCGPYCLTDYDKEHGTYRFEAFQDYWGPRPRVDVMEFVPVSDPVLALEKGEIDISGIPADVLPRFEQDPRFQVTVNPGFWGYRLIFNMEEVPVFQERDFRQAVAWALDLEDLVEKIARGAAIPGSPGILTRHHVWYNPDLPQYGGDPTRAGEILKNAGLSGGHSFELLVGEGPEVRIGEILKEQLARVDIDLRVVSVDMKSRDSRIREGSYQLALVGHGGWGGDPDYLRTRFSTQLSDWYSGTPGYENPEIDRLLQEQIRETDEGRRKEMIFELQGILAEDVPEIPLYNTTGYTVFRQDKYDGWMYMFDHHSLSHSKLSFLKR